MLLKTLFMVGLLTMLVTTLLMVADNAGKVLAEHSLDILQQHWGSIAVACCPKDYGRVRKLRVSGNLVALLMMNGSKVFKLAAGEMQGGDSQDSWQPIRKHAWVVFPQPVSPPTTTRSWSARAASSPAWI